MAFLIAGKSVPQASSTTWARATPLNWPAFSATASTSTTSETSPRQVQTNTPTRGSSSLISRSALSGFGFCVLCFGLTPRPETRNTELKTPADSTTVSGMSFGSRNAPPTNTPGRVVWWGAKRSVAQNPNSFSSTPSLPARAWNPSGGASPTARTTMPKSSSRRAPSSPTKASQQVVGLGHFP